MQVIDRQTLDAMIRELLDPVYTEDAEVARLGAIVPAQYILVGELSKAGSSYMLNLRVADSKTGAAQYTYESLVVQAALEDFSAIKGASEDLLAQMGITLTDAGKEALHGANRRTVDAETALAKGVTAQRGGGTVAALNYYSEAASLNAGLTEADQRLAALNKKISSGDIGENIRNDIERRGAWVKLLDEAIAFYQQNPCYDMVYYTKPDIGDVNYDNNTALVRFDIWLEPNAGYGAMLKIVRALMKTGMEGQWRLEGAVLDLLRVGLAPVSPGGVLYVEAELLDEQGDYLATGVADLFMHSPTAPPHYETHTPTATGPVVMNYHGHLSKALGFRADAALISNGMRLSGIMVQTEAEAARQRRGMQIYRYRFPFTGPVRVIPSEKPRSEYYRGKKNVEVRQSGYITFTFR
jgi:hypothetical protein